MDASFPVLVVKLSLDEQSTYSEHKPILPVEQKGYLRCTPIDKDLMRIDEHLYSTRSAPFHTDQCARDWEDAGKLP
jgi:hypothetical protein